MQVLHQYTACLTPREGQAVPAVSAEQRTECVSGVLAVLLWASQHALPRAAGYRRVGDVYWPAPGDAFAATTLTDADKREKKEKKREKKERKEKKKRESEDSEDSEEQAKKKKKKRKEKTDDP